MRLDQSRKRVLVTGATGFVGSHVVKALLRRNHEVIIATRPASDLRRLSEIKKKLQTVHYQELLADTGLSRYGRLDAVLHIATAYGRGNDRASEVVEANLHFPLRLLETAVRNEIALFVNTDTFSTKGGKLYPHLLHYSLSKRQFQEWARSITAGKPLRFANMMLEHVYGPNDNLDKFSRSMIRSCLINCPRIELTAGDQCRDFVYVEDVGDAYVRLLESSQHPTDENYEVGTGSAIAVRTWVETMHKICGSASLLEFGTLPYREGEIMYSQANTDKLRAIGWTAQTSLTDGLRKTIDWERSELSQE